MKLFGRDGRPRNGEHTEGVDERCEYWVKGFRCKEPSAGELRGGHMMLRDHLPWGMCAEHVRPEWHPADLRKHLYRW